MSRSPIVHFLVAGIALFAVASVWPGAPVRKSVEIRRSEIEQAISDYQARIRRPVKAEEARAIEGRIIENALWLEQAWALGLHTVDPIVRQRLVQNMRFLDGEIDLPEADRLRRAFELGMERSDPVIRRRLVDRVQALLVAGVREASPNEQTLRSHYEDNSSLWHTPVLLDLSHVFLSRDRRGATAREDAAALFEILVEGRLSVEQSIERGDPFLSGHRIRAATLARITSRLGPEFASAIAEAESGQWIGPVDSAFGSHLVWVHERIDARVPAYDEIRARVLEDWYEGETQRAMRQEIQRHRENVEVRIIEDSAVSQSATSISEMDENRAR